MFGRERREIHKVGLKRIVFVCIGVLKKGRTFSTIFIFLYLSFLFIDKIESSLEPTLKTF
jgi:hypothetical protein